MYSAKVRSDAMNVAVNVLEEAKALGYENVHNVYNEKEKVDNYTYYYDLNVEEYEDVSGDSNPINVKKIKVDVSYEYDDEEYNIAFETLVYEE